MGLQRTPPPGRSTNQDAGPSNPGDSSITSDSSQAFVPRNPGVMRSPQSGSTGASSSSRPAPSPAPAPAPTTAPAIVRNIPATPAPQLLAPVDEGNVSTTPSYAPPAPAPSTPPARGRSPTPVEPPSATDIPEPEASRPEPTTPANKRRKSRHPDPPPPAAEEMSIDSSNGNEGLSGIETKMMYGRRYQLMMDTLELAVKNSSHRMK
jgi:hypothetical protein